MKLTNTSITHERFAEIAETRILLRGRCNIYPRHVAVALEIFTTHLAGPNRYLVTVTYESHEPNLGASLDHRCTVEGWQVAENPRRAAGVIFERWRGSPDCVWWSLDEPVVVTIRRREDRNWKPVPPTHFHFVRHYTGVRAVLATELQKSPFTLKAACLTTCYLRLDGFLQEQLRTWEKLAASLT